MTVPILGWLCWTGPLVTHLDAYVGTAFAGTATVTQTLNDSLGLTTQLRLELIANGRKSVVVQETEYDQNARPVRMFLMQTGPSNSQSTKVTFRNSVATVVVESSAGSHESKVPAPSGADIRATSEFWFLKNQPVIGALCNYFRFDAAALKWQEASALFERDETIEINGESFSCHKLVQKTSSAWLDTAGRPVKMVSGGVQFVRSKKQ